MTVICICAIERHQAPSSAIELTASNFGGECETAKTTTLHTQSTHMMCTSKRCCMRKARKRWVWERDVLCLPEKSRTDSYSSVLLNHTPRPGVEGEGEYVLFYSDRSLYTTHFQRPRQNHHLSYCVSWVNSSETNSETVDYRTEIMPISWYNKPKMMQVFYTALFCTFI